MYQSLVNDENANVRKQAAISLKDLIKKSNGLFDKELCELFNAILRDEHDFIRLQLVYSLLAFNKPSKQIQETLLKIFQ